MCDGCKIDDVEEDDKFLLKTIMMMNIFITVIIIISLGGVGESKKMVWGGG